MKIVVTGAAGLVGEALRPHLASRFEQVVLSDLRPVTDLRENESFQAGDIEEAAFLDDLLVEADGIVHLAGLVGPDFTFEEVMGANVNGTYQLFEAACRQGLSRIIYASSHHAVGFLPRGATIDETTPPRADSWYGASKAFGEIIAAYFADKHGLDVLSIRVGYVGDEAPDERRLHTWCSPHDLANLIQLGLHSEGLGYRLVYGVSNTPGPFFDNRAASDLGYTPRDHSLDHLGDPALASALPNPNELEHCFVGGHFAAQGFRGDLHRLLREHGLTT